MHKPRHPFQLGRRALIKASAATLAGAAIGSALPGVMQPARAQQSEPARKLVVVLNSGGWDTTYALDPKPGLASVDAPEGAVRMFGELPIFTHASRPAVTRFFTQYAERCALIRGLQVRSFVHPDCIKRLLTGSPSETTPDLCAISAFELARDLPVPYLALGGQARSGQLAAITGRTGTSNQLSALVDPLSAKKHGDDFVSSLDRADRLRAFATRSGIGDYTLELNVQIPLAVHALRDGLSHSVLLQTDNWDTHQGNYRQTAQHEMLFSALSTLVVTLEQEKLLDSTMVLVISEMGRTPKLNGEQGKDHWPVTSAFLLGAGVRGGKIYGESSDELDALSIDFETGAAKSDGQQLQASSLVAGVLTAVGVKSESYLPGVEAFTAFMG